MSSFARPKILVIDDEPEILFFLQRSLSERGFEVVTALEGSQGIDLYGEGNTDLVLVGLRLPGMNGIQVIQRLKEHDPKVMPVVLTACGSVESVVEAMKAGAEEYLTKPVDLEHLKIVLNKILEKQRQNKELSLPKEQLVQQGSFEKLVGVSQEMQQMFRLIRDLADSETNVLIQGETGTGKELVARALHNCSRRCQAPFVPINCGALPENILESELFGHEKGAFTGADRRKHGLIEQAEGGTLFLDEMDTATPAFQVKLLRVIEGREMFRVGGEQPIRLDFRLLTATNVDLGKCVSHGGFRADLFYRLKTGVVVLPPLRARKVDIPVLAIHFTTRCAEAIGKPVTGITPEAMMLLKAHEWPGNVRELANAIEQAILVCRGDRISLDDLLPSLKTWACGSGDGDICDLPLRQARGQFEQQYLREVLARTNGSIVEAARKAGINRQHFYVKMKHYGILRDQ